MPAEGVLQILLFDQHGGLPTAPTHYKGNCVRNEQFIIVKAINDNGTNTYDIILNKSKIFFIRQHDLDKDIFTLYLTEDCRDGCSINIVGKSFARKLDTLN